MGSTPAIFSKIAWNLFLQLNLSCQTVIFPYNYAIQRATFTAGVGACHKKIRYQAPGAIPESPVWQFS